ncbi:DEAD/DEAH box helicase [Hydrogenoanaerobacterium sp.]|uniref:DEAD/DEAH box helicase n=1 Tax=Hydrogenoanaerobacterium sp. TaxID=2953763 RepID=UPI00289F38BC|nr:DEAD/DEAH box helicase [Hydrogenoanaerobacterium sp.]
MNFQDLQLIPPILRALQTQNYSEPTPIQAQAIPPVLAGRDVLGCAQTGTGKTAAFAIPILQKLSETSAPKGMRRIRALILTPTRELALQIYESFEAYGAHLKLRCCVIFGGVSQKPQEEQLRRGVDILVATPGRLNDLISQGIISLKDIEIFVLDEADRMLDMGFIHDVKRVIAQTPPKKQTLLFSATMPPEITAIAENVLVDPIKVAVTPVSSTVDKIEQSVYFVDKANKRELLKYLLKDPVITSALVFTRTKHGADRVVRELTRANFKAAAIHGDKSQGARQTALSNFKNGTIRVLVATDIAARGIDIDELSHVINFDLPNIPETYVHRIGRTGRAGLSGIAISFCDIEEKPYLMDILKVIKRDIPAVTDHPYPMMVFEVPPKEPKPPRPARRDCAQSAPRNQGAKNQTASSPHKQNGQGTGKGSKQGKAGAPTEPRAPKPRSHKPSGRRPAPAKSGSANAPVTKNAYFRKG